MQVRLIDDLYKVLEAVSVGSCDVKEVQTTFRQDLRLAAKASVFDFWPLPKDDVASSTQPLTAYQLSSLLAQAINCSHLPETLNLLEFLLKALPSRSTYNCPELLEFLDLLANISIDRATPSICRDQLQQMLRPWMQPVQRALAKLAPVHLSVTSSADISTDSQQHSPATVSIPHWLSNTAGSYTEERPLFEQMVCAVVKLCCPHLGCSLFQLSASHHCCTGVALLAASASLSLFTHDRCACTTCLPLNSLSSCVHACSKVTFVLPCRPPMSGRLLLATLKWLRRMT